MTIYTVTLETGLQIQVNADSVSDAMNLAEAQRAWKAVDAEIYEPEFDRINHGPFAHPVSESDDQMFVRTLEARHMSSWTDAEMARYNHLTGQE